MTACERIEFSRARLRAAMSPPPAPAAGSESPTSSWVQRLKQLPIVSLVVDSFNAWWAGHPLHAAGEVAAQASSAVIRPVARRHPFTLVLVAGAIGALLAWSRPWRWAFRPALLAGLAPQFVSRVVANLPIESWMTVLGAALASPGARADTSAHVSAASGNSHAASFDPLATSPMSP